ncbi:hypothetical protein PSHT_00526 [Puccinia striiformis]|uniref:Uncharacterized protein n=1 Tax=Puccinia striiformis TaxID=27350 RepID=A0A2S4WMQ6_9BASI|nr:hypothetical protein PSHT_00526 [Puccinia striiformis]
MATSQTVPTPSTNLTILNKPSSSETPKLTIWFDIDNTLYSRHCKINEFMSEKILAYFIKLGLPLEQAPGTTYEVWCITNAYKTHALRVLKIMNLSDLIEGVVSCDYTNHNFHCKPEKGLSLPLHIYTLLEPLHFRPCSVRLFFLDVKFLLCLKTELCNSEEYYQESIVRSLGQDPTPTNLEATDFTNHLLVDDALINIVGASKIGYGSSVHFDEDSTTGNGSSSTVKTEDGTEYQRITALDQLRNLDIWKDCFLKK